MVIMFYLIQFHRRQTKKRSNREADVPFTQVTGINHRLTKQ